MREFLMFDGNDFRHAALNAGGDDLLAMWQPKAPAQVALPARRARPGPRAAQGPRFRNSWTGNEYWLVGGKAGS